MHVGFDIGATTARFISIDAAGEAIDYDSARSRGWSVDDAFTFIADHVTDDAKSIGVALAAQLSADQKNVVNAPNLDWKNVAFCAPLKARVPDIPIALLNDLNAAVFAEARLGCAKGFSDILGVFVGSGVGGAIIHDGDLVLGAAGVAGEIGHIKVSTEPSARLCGCGQRGCLEAYVGGVHLEEMVRELLPALVTKSRLVDVAKADSMVADNRSIEAIWHRGADQLATALANACTLLNPGVLVLGGGVLENAPAFKELTMAKLTQRISATAAASLEVRFASLEDRAGALGAALFAKQS